MVSTCMIAIPAGCRPFHQWASQGRGHPFVHCRGRVPINRNAHLDLSLVISILCAGLVMLLTTVLSVKSRLDTSVPSNLLRGT